jgi:hypothetical protein
MYFVNFSGIYKMNKFIRVTLFAPLLSSVLFLENSFAMEKESYQDCSSSGNLTLATQENPNNGVYEEKGAYYQYHNNQLYCYYQDQWYQYYEGKYYPLTTNDEDYTYTSYTPVSYQYTKISFSQTRGNKESLSSDEIKAGKAVTQIMEENNSSIDKDTLYNKIIEAYPYHPVMILNIAKAFRHVNLVEGANPQERITKNKYTIYDLGLLDVSIQLLKHLETYCKKMNLSNIDYSTQLNTSQRHYDETLKELKN